MNINFEDEKLNVILYDGDSEEVNTLLEEEFGSGFVVGETVIICYDGMVDMIKSVLFDK